MSRLVAHRGQKASLPENTLESMAQAIRCGASAVEFDVQLTADFVPVVCHDVSLLRTAGIDIDITKSGYSDIKDICVGEASRFGDLYHSVNLPSLQKMVAMLGGSSEVTVFVELKQESFDVFGIDIFLKPVLAQLEFISQRCVVIADNLQALIRLKQLTSLPLPVGWIIHRWHDDDLIMARQTEVDYLLINHKYYDPQRNHDFSADPWQWLMYESSDLEHVLSLFELGIAYVETDDICSLIKHMPKETG